MGKNEHKEILQLGHNTLPQIGQMFLLLFHFRENFGNQTMQITK